GLRWGSGFPHQRVARRVSAARPVLSAVPTGIAALWYGPCPSTHHAPDSGGRGWPPGGDAARGGADRVGLGLSARGRVLAAPWGAERPTAAGSQRGDLRRSPRRGRVAVAHHGR